MKIDSIRLSLIAAIVLAAAPAALAQQGQQHPFPEGDHCITCHTDMGGDLAKPVSLFAWDVHLGAGLSCADCHGGDPTTEDPEAAMDPAKGFIGAPGPLEIPEFCNRCHGDAAYMKEYKPGLPVDQYIKYLTSVHGKKNKAGDKKVAQCASCHIAHNIKPANDPTSSTYATNIPATCGHCHADSAYMAEYRIPTDQLAGYTKSAHGKALLDRHDLGAPACNDCHGNHAASPPITAAIANVCGNCHAFNAQLFAESPHKAAYEDLGIPACEICHGAHDIQKLSVENLGQGPESKCMECHAPDDGTRGIAVADAMQRDLMKLDSAYEHADSLLKLADQKGMYVTDAEFELNDARQARVQAQTTVHAFNDSLMKLKVDSGMVIVSKVSATAEAAVKESSFRRFGLTISTLIISILAVLLWLKIRSMEAKK